jgi:hypothetical protein
MVRSSFKGTATLLGFVLGIASAGEAITAGLLVMLVTSDKIVQTENLQPSLSSAIALSLAIIMLVIGFLLIRGSLWIWRFSVFGGALNLAIGLMTVVSSYGTMSLIGSDMTSTLHDFLIASYIFTSAGSITSGVLGSFAHHEQLTRRFALSSLSMNFKVLVSANGRDHQVEVSGITTGAELRETACQLENVPKGKVRLLFQGKGVKDEVTLKELGAGEGDRFTLITG